MPTADRTRFSVKLKVCAKDRDGKDGTCPPYSTHHWHTDNAGNDIGLDKPLNTGDHQRIIDLQLAGRCIDRPSSPQYGCRCGIVSAP